MAEPLKNQFGTQIPEKIAKMIEPVLCSFDPQQFIADCLLDYDDLSLTHRAQILIRSLGPKLASTEEFGLDPFLYLPYVYCASEYGLEHFDEDPAPIIPLLEQLKDDPDLYIRRSVANNLNDIAKDHTNIVNDLMGVWIKHADANRMWVIKHAMRTLIKKGNSNSLTILGYSEPKEIYLETQKATPTTARIGGNVTLSFELSNQSKRLQKLVVDCKVHFIKANGRASPKVFKLKNIELAPGTHQVISKKIGLQQLTTRTHYIGEHKVTLMVNGKHFPAMSFLLIE